MPHECRAQDVHLMLHISYKHKATAGAMQGFRAAGLVRYYAFLRNIFFFFRKSEIRAHYAYELNFLRSQLSFCIYGLYRLHISCALRPCNSFTLVQIYRYIMFVISEKLVSLESSLHFICHVHATSLIYYV